MEALWKHKWKYYKWNTMEALMVVAKELGEANARMVEVANALASSPNDIDRQGDLKRAAESVRNTIKFSMIGADRIFNTSPEIEIQGCI